ncbi:MAG TPA: hypothetical protein VIF63_04635 [Candidatus Limnocylindrales bacterium]|jgi:hypothetical protein
MSGLVLIFAAFVVLAALDLIAASNGVDSRQDFDDVHAPVRGLR